MRQHASNGLINEVMDGAAVAEADFGFRGVDVDIDAGRVQRQIQQIDREPVAMQDVFIGCADSMCQ